MADHDPTDPTGLPPDDESHEKSASADGADVAGEPERSDEGETQPEAAESADGDNGAESAPRAKTPQDEIDEALAAAQAAVASLQGDVSGDGSGGEDVMAETMSSMAGEGAGGGDGRDESPAPFELQALESKGRDGSGGEIDLLSDVNLNVKIELGRTRMLVEDVLKLGDGAVVELDKLAGDPVDVYVNDRLIAKGEVLVLNDNFCVRINEIVDGNAATEEARKRA